MQLDNDNPHVDLQMVARARGSAIGRHGGKRKAERRETAIPGDDPSAERARAKRIRSRGSGNVSGEREPQSHGIPVPPEEAEGGPAASAIDSLPRELLEMILERAVTGEASPCSSPVRLVSRSWHRLHRDLPTVRNWRQDLPLRLYAELLAVVLLFNDYPTRLVLGPPPFPRADIEGNPSTAQPSELTWSGRDLRIRTRWGRLAMVAEIVAAFRAHPDADVRIEDWRWDDGAVEMLAALHPRTFATLLRVRRPFPGGLRRWALRQKPGHVVLARPSSWKTDLLASEDTLSAAVQDRCRCAYLVFGDHPPGTINARGGGWVHSSSAERRGSTA